MLEVCVRLICALIMSVFGFYVIKKITGSNDKLLNIKNMIYILILCSITVFLYRIQYTAIYSVTIFSLQIIIYKEIFNLRTEESMIACGILMALVFAGDVFMSTIVRNFFTVKELRNVWYLCILSNVLVVTFGTALINIKVILNQLKAFYKNISKRKSVSNIIFISLLVIALSTITQATRDYKELKVDYFINVIIMLIFFILTYLFVKSRNSYDKLNVEYENLFTYVQNFEDWIEKEQLNRHEYKNQLAVLRCLTTEKKVKDKIDEILEDSINIEGQVVHQLKMLPKGGIKGLMYYKSAIAQKNKIDLEVDVSLETHSILEKLPEKDIKTLCRLIGIYFDNAIEAAR